MGRKSSVGRALLLVGALAVAGLAGMWGAGPARADGDPGAIDLGSVAFYMQRLSASRTAQGAAIRRLIENGPADLVREEGAARAAGIPLSTRDLQVYAPPGEDAAPLYARIAKMLRADPLKEDLSEWMGKPLSRDDLTRLQGVLARRAAVTALMRQAASKGAYRYPPDFLIVNSFRSMSFMMTFRKTARELGGESWIEWEEGKRTAAIGTGALDFNIARQCMGDPLAINFLVAIAIEGIGRADLADLMESAGPDAPLDERIARVVETESPRYDLQGVIAGEMSFAIQQTEYMESHLTPDVLDPVRFKNAPPYTAAEKRFLTRALDAGAAYVLRVDRRLYHDAATPLPGRLALMKRDAAPVPDSVTPGDFMPDEAGASEILVETARIQASTLGKERCLAAGARVLAYRARHGRFPAALRDAIRNPPLDPFTGRPLRYRQERGGFLVYSVGPSGTFTGDMTGRLPGQEAYFRYPRAG